MKALGLIAGFILLIPAIAFLLVVVFVCISCSTYNMERYTREIDNEIARRRIIAAGLSRAETPSAAATGNARGLDESRMKSCSELIVAEMNESGAVVSCSICLEEYGAKEKVRQIKSCEHRFHADCVDHWFLKNTTCPICRVSLLDDKL